MDVRYKKPFLLLLTSMLIVGGSSNVFSATFEWEYRGVITKVDNDLGWLTSPSKGKLLSTPQVGDPWSVRVIYNTAEIGPNNEISLDKSYYDAIDRAYLSIGKDTVLLKTDGIGAMGPWGAETDLNRTKINTYWEPEFESRLYDVYPSEFLSHQIAWQGLDFYVLYSQLSEGEILSTVPPNINSALDTYMSWTIADDAYSGFFADSIVGEIQSISVSAVPTPSALWLFASGLLAVFTQARLRQPR